MLDVQRSVGRFEIHRELGRGGMAVVYLARQADLDRQVALKELGSFHTSDEMSAERFVRESRVVGSLNHPNVVTVYEYFEDEGTPYIAMEYVDGGSLRPWMGRLSVAQVAGVFEAVLAGLAHAAKRGIIHRDLKPENLMVTAEGTIKIADFGIAKALNEATVGRLLTATGTTVGTPTYMSPEQAMGRDLGPWTDLYSVGVMAYEMVVGHVPFHDAETPMAILMRHVNEPIPDPREACPDLDPELAGWIERLLVKDPAVRTQSAQQAWDELEEIVLGILGPRWRRDARLLEPELPGTVTEEQPLTPAPFESESDNGFATLPSTDSRTPAGVTSFEWPTSGPRRRRGLLWIVPAGAVAVASMLLGVLVAVSLRDPGNDVQAKRRQPTTTVIETSTRPHHPREGRPSRPGPVARRTTLTRTDTAVVATIRFTRARLKRNTLATRDSDLTDGSAEVLIAQRGLVSAIGTNKLAGLSFKPIRTPNRLTIQLSGPPGAFTTVEARPDRTGRRVAIIATKKPKATPAGRNSDGTTDRTTDRGTGRTGRTDRRTRAERKFGDDGGDSRKRCSPAQLFKGTC